MPNYPTILEPPSSAMPQGFTNSKVKIGEHALGEGVLCALGYV